MTKLKIEFVERELSYLDHELQICKELIIGNEDLLILQLKEIIEKINHIIKVLRKED